MNVIYVGKFHNIFMINSSNWIQNISVTTDERLSLKLVLNKDGIRRNVES